MAIRGFDTRSPRWATTAVFFVNGAVIGTWVAQIPWVQQRFGLEKATLGLLLLAMPIAVILMVPVAGHLVVRIGSERATLLGAAACIVAVNLPLLAPSPWLVAVALPLLGASSALMDVGMNAHGVHVEGKLDRPIMSSLHAGWAFVDADVVRPVGDMLAKLYDAFVAEDATLVEVNPLIVTADRQVRALDAKVTLDDNALYRHPDNAGLRNKDAEDPQEQMARERGLTYVKLDGNVGILGNGAGLVMSTLDVVKYAGGEPANFLDAGGGANAEQITQAVEVILSNEKVTAVLFNIFGGITRCDEVAKGLIEAFNQIKPTVPFVVRLDGTNGEEGRAMLAAAALPNVYTESTMDGAAARVVQLAAAS
jgi:CoA-ligase/Major Facilitator Superfamily